ncbi:potassium channel subfamily K member 13a isoform X2 [Stegostoma tigrinum]|uniref:potassium channel subfamily K member 13a isoform X2 n=1 Tax=Stegostoma tigrinum TaxID=3053191 RepID=UPI00286FD390|nr:potassium channel subfamily K member 13a isoform X2 [Stegostoma tigrinum]
MAGRCSRHGCCPLNEENGRLALLAALLAVYLVCGAAVFSAIEQPKEREAQRRWLQTKGNFSRRYNISGAELSRFLRDYEKAHVAGVRVDETRPRWDFTGSFYFVGTVVSTIGFGMTTPATVSGKVFLIFYGLVGCAATILFFNLFLERLITVLAYILKSCHERRLRRSGMLPQENCPEPGTAAEVDSLAGWKPSVYYVMLILGLAAIAISCCASAMYTPVEGWSYLDSIYFCFVAFSTIGFGDLVSSQNMRYDYQGFYRFGNFLFILMGVCCIYSLFNVISIVIKQFLNWSLRRLECQCCARCQRRFLRSGRNAVAPGLTRRKISIETDAFNESEVADGRRLSGEMISMKDLLASNKVSLAIMQKQLLETANGHPRVSGHPHHQPRHNGFSEGVGALAIMNNRLAETSMDR